MPKSHIVNPPPAPDPSGLAAALNVLGTANIFIDMSGIQQVGSLLDNLVKQTGGTAAAGSGSAGRPTSSQAGLQPTP